MLIKYWLPYNLSFALLKSLLTYFFSTKSGHSVTSQKSQGSHHSFRSQQSDKLGGERALQMVGIQKVIEHKTIEHFENLNID